LKKKADDMKNLADNRFFWIVVLSDLRTVMMQAEGAETTNLTTPDNGGTNTDEGVWVDSFSPVMPDGYGSGSQSYTPGSSSPGRMRNGSDRRGMRAGMGAPPPAAVAVAASTSVSLPSGAAEVTNVVITCRGINRNTAANYGLAYSVRQYLTNSPSFSNPLTLGEIKFDEDTNTFTFDVTVNLRRHFKL
jgi:hypothetical protein